MKQATVTMAVAALRSAADDLMKSDRTEFVLGSTGILTDLTHSILRRLADKEPVSMRLIGLAISDIAYCLEKENTSQN